MTWGGYGEFSRYPARRVSLCDKCFCVRGGEYPHTDEMQQWVVYLVFLQIRTSTVFVYFV